MRVVFAGMLMPTLGGGPISSWLLLQELTRLGARIRAVSSVSPEIVDEFESVSRAHPEIPRFPYHSPQYLSDASQPRSEVVDVVEERQIELGIDQLLRQEPADLILAGREVEARAVAPVAARHDLPWVLRCGGFTLHLLATGMLQPYLRDSILRALPQAEATILQAGHLRSTAEQLGCRRITVIPSPVELSTFAPRPRPLALCAKWDIPTDARVVVHVSNMKRVKRVTDVVESAAHVLRSQPDVVYVIAGDGFCRATVEQQSRDLGIAHRFRFTGRLSQEEIPALLALADVVVMASAFEQQARVYLETQASGRVLISSDIAGARTVVEDGVTGLLYPVGDVEALAAVTQRALNDPALRSAIGERARKRVQAHSLDAIGARVAGLLEDVVRSYRPAHA